MTKKTSHWQEHSIKHKSHAQYDPSSALPENSGKIDIWNLFPFLSVLVN